MSGAASDGARDWAGDDREFLAADRRAMANEQRVVASANDAISEVREARLDAWELQIEARAIRTGPVHGPASSTAPPPDAVDGGVVGEEQAALARELEEATRAADATSRRTSPQLDDIALARAFAGIEEQLHAAGSVDELVKRIAQTALTIIPGCGRVTVTLDHPKVYNVGLSPDMGERIVEQGGGPALSFPLTISPGAPVEAVTAALSIYAAGPHGLHPAAAEIGAILASHASTAARHVIERVRLEGVVAQLEQALRSGGTTAEEPRRGVLPTP